MTCGNILVVERALSIRMIKEKIGEQQLLLSSQQNISLIIKYIVLFVGRYCNSMLELNSEIKCVTIERLF